MNIRWMVETLLAAATTDEQRHSIMVLISDAAAGVLEMGDDDAYRAYRAVLDCYFPPPPRPPHHDNGVWQVVWEHDKAAITTCANEIDAHTTAVYHSTLGDECVITIAGDGHARIYDDGVCVSEEYSPFD